jgi:hypothetical protein
MRTVYIALLATVVSFAAPLSAGTYEDNQAVAQEKQGQAYEARKAAKRAELEVRIPRFLASTVQRRLGGFTVVPTVKFQEMDSFWLIINEAYDAEFQIRGGYACKAWGMGKCDDVHKKCAIDLKVSCANAEGNVKELPWADILF